ncbi:unnamed protein product [Dicrocoelium dendriticum]|nr:unnamed protein product [Dicrocoelium dendriticum]
MPSSLPILVHILSKQCTLSGIFDCGREHATFSASFVTFIYDTALPASKISSESITILLRSSSVPASSELDSVRPQSAGEEQLHLQLAIAISKEEHDREERRRRAEEAKEEAKVQMALEQSRREDQELLEQQRVPVSTSADGVNTFSAGQTQPGEGLFSLVDTSLSAAPAHVPDPWSSPLADSLTTLGATSTSPSVIPIDDPWTNGAVGSPSKPAVSPPISTSAWGLNPGSVPLTPKSAVDLASNGAHSSPNEANGTADNDSNKDGGTPNRRHTPADFLGEHQRLVDLEKLVEKNPARVPPTSIFSFQLAASLEILIMVKLYKHISAVLIIMFHPSSPRLSCSDAPTSSLMFLKNDTCPGRSCIIVIGIALSLSYHSLFRRILPPHHHMSPTVFFILFSISLHLSSEFIFLSIVEFFLALLVM